VGKSDMTFQYDFDEQLKKSKEYEGCMDGIYKKYFNNVSSIKTISRVDEMNRQRAGVDTIITLNSNEYVVVQEKRRYRKFEGDFLIEYCSVWQDEESKALGWIYTIDADYIFTVYEKSSMVKVYPVVQLKLAWFSNSHKWTNPHLYKNGRTETRQRGGCRGYETLWCAVPCEELEQEILKTMRFDFQQTFDV
jgi:hypothetical protein